MSAPLRAFPYCISKFKCVSFISSCQQLTYNVASEAVFVFILMALCHDVCCQFCAIPRHCLFKYCLPTVLFLFSFWNSHCSGIKPLGIFAQTSLHVAFQSSVLTCPVSDR